MFSKKISYICGKIAFETRFRENECNTLCVINLLYPDKLKKEKTIIYNNTEKWQTKRNF